MDGLRPAFTDLALRDEIRFLSVVFWRNQFHSPGGRGESSVLAQTSALARRGIVQKCHGRGSGHQSPTFCAGYPAETPAVAYPRHRPFGSRCCHHQLPGPDTDPCPGYDQATALPATDSGRADPTRVITFNLVPACLEVVDTFRGTPRTNRLSVFFCLRVPLPRKNPDERLPTTPQDRAR